MSRLPSPLVGVAPVLASAGVTQGAEPKKSEWVLSEVVESLAFRDRVSGALAEVAAQQLEAGNPLQASFAAEACLRIDN